MKYQVCMSPNNGQLVVAVPLFKMDNSEEMAHLQGYTVSIMQTQKPLAYIIDGGAKMGHPQVMSAKFIEAQLEFLGDL